MLPKSSLCWLQKALESCGKRSRLQTLLSAALLREKLPLVSFLIFFEDYIQIFYAFVGFVSPAKEYLAVVNQKDVRNIYLVDWLSGYSGVVSQSCTFHADSSFQSGLLDPVRMC